MSQVFPFNLPGSTVFYIVLFVATLIVHFVFMSYVLAGSVWVLAGQFRSREKASEITDALSDWMPVMLSGAITAGVAPLLFIQILYRPQFYTANLLQFNRWMAILPVLIVLFYLAYVIKAQGSQRTAVQKLASLVSVGAVLFIAWSWSGNHELSLQELSVWQTHYAAGSSVHEQLIVVLRLTMWVTLTFPVLCCLLAWQMRYVQPVTGDQPAGIARTSAVAICGSALFLIAALVAARELPAEARTAVLSSQGWLWLLTGAGGWALQMAGWVQRLRTRIDGSGTRWLLTVGIALQLTGTMMVRELIRVVRLEDRIDFASHAEAAAAEGLWLFLLFVVINGAAAIWCIRLVRSASGNPSAQDVKASDSTASEDVSPDR